MRRIFLWAIILALSSAMLVPNAKTGANEGLAWIDTEIVKVGELPVRGQNDAAIACSGSVSLIQLANAADFRAACVYGAAGERRMARMKEDNGQIAYAFSYANEAKFYRIEDMCLGEGRCMYSQSQDVAFIWRQGTPALIRDFSQRLIRTGGSEVRYRIQDNQGASVSAGEGLSVKSVALSSDGRWAAAEVAAHGAVRIDMQTGRHVWIASFTSPGSMPGGDAYDVAISDDGMWLAVSGWLGGIQVYAVTDTCGYEGTYRTTGFVACPSVDLPVTSLLSGYYYTEGMRFSGDGMRLTVTAATQLGGVRATLAPRSSSPEAMPYIAFGDSFTSGEGEIMDIFYLPSTNTALNRCHVSTRSYPYLLGAYWEYMAESHACSGSRMSDVERARRAIFESSARAIAPAIVSLGVGGNDINVMGKLKECLGLDMCDWARKEKRLATVLESQAILPGLIDLIQRIQRDATAPMFLVGYPLVINDEPLALCSPLIHTLLNSDERRYMNEAVRYLNNVLEAAAAFTDVTFVDIEDSLMGERLCDVSEASMNGIRIGDDIGPIATLPDMKLIGAESFHPTPAGHVRIANKIKEKLANFWEQPMCMGCRGLEGIEEYWREGGDPSPHTVRRMAGTFLERLTMQSGGVLRITTPAGIFAPLTLVRVELHSDVQELGSYSSNSNGSFTAEFLLPKGVEGYHTVHLIGQTHSGEVLDVYEPLFIEPGSEQTVSDFGAIRSGSSAVVRSPLTQPALSTSTSSATVTVPNILGISRTASPSKSTEVVTSMPGNSSYVWYGAAIIGGILGVFAIRHLRRKV